MVILYIGTGEIAAALFKICDACPAAASGGSGTSPAVLDDTVTKDRSSPAGAGSKLPQITATLAAERQSAKKFGFPDDTLERRRSIGHLPLSHTVRLLSSGETGEFHAIATGQISDELPSS